MKKLISHRGNLSGPNVLEENKPDYLDKALELFECEVDLWVVGNRYLLGHDFGQYEVSFRWLEDRAGRFWIHCKNVYALEFCLGTNWNYFFHNTDQYTLTSRGVPWSYPTATPIMNAIIAVPEVHYGKQGTADLIKGSLIAGICTDYPLEYKNL